MNSQLRIGQGGEIGINFRGTNFEIVENQPRKTNSLRNLLIGTNFEIFWDPLIFLGDLHRPFSKFISNIKIEVDFPKRIEVCSFEVNTRPG